MVQKRSWLMLGLLSSLVGCASQPPPPSSPSQPPVYKRQVSQMKTVGIQVIQHGDRLMLVIPTDLYFEPKSTTVREERQTDLQEMAKFTKYFADTYPNTIIRVTGYTDRVYSHQTQLALSQSYAEAVSAYLFNAGINPTRIATQGRGSNEPVAEEHAPKSAALNRRVVIQVN